MGKKARRGFAALPSELSDAGTNALDRKPVLWAIGQHPRPISMSSINTPTWQPPQRQASQPPDSYFGIRSDQSFAQAMHR
jgi:hypothetical protein